MYLFIFKVKVVTQEPYSASNNSSCPDCVWARPLALGTSWGPSTRITFNPKGADM